MLKYCCMNNLRSLLDHISATTTYVMRREEHLWNVSVLQRVHKSNLVLTHLQKHSCIKMTADQLKAVSVRNRHSVTTPQSVNCLGKRNSIPRRLSPPASHLMGVKQPERDSTSPLRIFPMLTSLPQPLLFTSYISPLFPCLVTSSPKAGDSMLLRNVGTDLQIHMTSKPTTSTTA
jgi:hypothetical protein